MFGCNDTVEQFFCVMNAIRIYIYAYALGHCKLSWKCSLAGIKSIKPQSLSIKSKNARW